MMEVVHIEDRGYTIYMVVQSERSGDIMTEEMCQMMIMMVVPTQLLNSRRRKISLANFPLL